MTSSLQTDELIGALLDQLAAVVPFDTGTLWLRRDNMLMVRSARGYADREQREGLMVALEDSLLMRDMIVTGKGVGPLLSDVGRRLDQVQDDGSETAD